MAIIRSSNSSDELVIEPLSKAARMVLFDSLGNPVSNAFPLSVAISQPIVIGPGDVEIGTVDQGEAALPANAWPIKLYGGQDYEADVSLTGALKVDGSAQVQPISGNVNVSNFPAQANIRTIADVLLGTDNGLITNSLLYGRSSAGGGTYVPVKVTPAGGVVTDGSGVTQPISGSVSVSNFPAEMEIKNDSGNPVPVSGTVVASVSGTVAVSNFPASQAVTGTFFQATQPVSNTNLDVALSTRLKPADTLTKVATVDTITNPVAVTGTFFQSVQPTTASDVLTKGTQGATGFSVQDLKDAGRVIKTYYAIAATSATTEALMTLTPNSDGTSGTPGTSFTVTSGKRFRIQQLIASIHTTTAAVIFNRFILRMSSSGAVTTSSAVIAVAEVGDASAVINSAGQLAISFPDGIELSGTMQFGVSHISSVATAVENIAILGYEY